MHTHFRNAVLATALSCLTLPAFAQGMPHDMSGHDMSTRTRADELSSGEVRQLDLKTRKLTIRHGELRNLGMPGMTMVFVLKPGLAVPDGLKPGDRIRFRAEEVGGVLTVTTLQRQP